MELITSLDALRPAGDCAVALGFFDGVHLGHRAVLGAAAACRARGLIPAVFTFSLSRPEERGTRVPAGKTGGRIYTDEQRVRLLAECGIELVFLPDFRQIAQLSDRDFAALLCGQGRAKAVFCGEDYRFSRGAAADAGRLRELCAPYGAAARTVGPVTLLGERVSSTRIRALLRQGDVAGAGKLLGRPYFVDTRVETGQRLGRQLGFPTVNQPFAHDAVLPRFGVYATRAWAQGRWHPAVTSVGVRPTVGEHLEPRAETYLMDYSGDLYGQCVTVEFIDFLRGEQRFESLAALAQQIGRDSAAARKLLLERGAPEESDGRKR